MLGANFLVCAAALLATASFADAGALPGGICYSPWHHDKVNADVVNKDFKQIGQYFSAVRTYHASFSGLNVIDAAVSAGVQISVTIQMGDKNGIAGEIAAACDGAKRNPSAVRSIMVGNENLQNGGFGTFSAGELVTYINQLKGCTAGTGIKIGSVQRINEWLSAPGAPELSAACDVIGVNIYPFFTPGDTKPIDKLKAQWAQMTAKYGEDKCALHETGWPRHGSPSNGNVPSKDTLQSFLNDFAVWSAEHTRSYFFMMYDTKVSYTGDDFETSFGLADTNGVLQVSIPSGNGAPPQNTPAPAPAPAPSAPAPAPPAPAPAPPAPAPGTPAPGAPAPGAPAPAPGAPAPAPGAPAPAPGAPAPAPGTPAPAPGAPAPAPGTPAPAPGAPAPGAPAPGAPGAGKPGAPAPGAPAPAPPAPGAPAPGAPGAGAPGAPGAGAPGAPAPGAPAPGAPAPAPPAPGKPGVAPPAPGNQTPGQNSGEVGKDGETPKKKGKKSKKDCEA